ncbi:hypothetical protein BGW38_001303 [Lunasporangiospora selenospora]|uniref:MIR domain-containing protein n=1 Tax=Lunasporangiospora selenospora TaxID=979761 RepID=A0A9P6KE78_9FUNG|nr:hypothetical protein BGW38_001303 [Lunasporangiospora selenospora]
MIYKTSPSTTLYLHSHNRRSINHADHNEVTGYKYHDSDNDWIVTKPDGQSDPDHEVVDAKGDGQGVDAGPSQPSRPGPSNSQYLQWKDVFWLRHANTGNFLHSMASLKISQGFQEVTAYDQPHSNNDWIIEETTWLRQQILSDE